METQKANRLITEATFIVEDGSQLEVVECLQKCRSALQASGERAAAWLENRDCTGKISCMKHGHGEGACSVPRAQCRDRHTLLLSMWGGDLRNRYNSGWLSLRAREGLASAWANTCQSYGPSVFPSDARATCLSFPHQVRQIGRYSQRCVAHLIQGFLRIPS